MSVGATKFSGLAMLLTLAVAVYGQVDNAPPSALARMTDAEIQELISGRGESDLKRICDSLLDQADAAARGDDPTARLRFVRTALTESRKINYREAELRALRQLSLIYFNEGKSELGLDALKQTIDLAARLGDRQTEADSFTNLGYFYNQRADLAAALDAYQRGLALETAIGSPNRARTLNGIGAIYMQTGDYDRAEASHRNALAVAEQLKDKEAVGNAYFHLGIINRNRGNYAEALRFYHQAVELTDTLASKDPGSFPSTAIRRHISGTYFLQGNIRLALDYVNQALALDERRGDFAGTAYSLQMVALIRFAQKNFAAGLPIAEKTIPMFEKVGDNEGLARSLTLLGNIYISTGDHPKAFEALSRALRMREASGSRDGAANARIALAKLSLAQSKYDEARDYAQRAAESVRSNGNRELLWQAQSLIGQIRLARSECVEARSALDEAIDTIERMRSEVVGGAGENSLFFAERVKPYQMLATMLAGQANPAESFEYAERAKARALLDSFRIGRNQQPAAMSEREKIEENALRGKVTMLNVRISALSNSKAADPQRFETLSAEREAARTALARFQASLYAMHPELRIKRSAVKAVKASEASELVDDRSALLEYMVADDSVLLYVFTKSAAGASEFAVHRIALGRVEMAQAVGRFRLSLAQRNLLFGKEARRLYDVLVRPAEMQLAGKTRVTIVPDDSLWELPFQALQSGEDKYLIDDVSVSYTPSLTILREMLASEPVKANSGMLAFVNPTGGSGGGTWPGFAALPEAEQRTTRLKWLLGPSNVRVFARGAADEATFKREAVRGLSILHLETHGVLDGSSPLNSYVLLAPDLVKGEDGRLEASEILELDLNVDLVVLSACETARGETRLGEGLVGLAWSFMNAGARGVIVSQWKVESSSTANLTTGFYKNLQHLGLQRKADALRLAALQIRQNPQTRHPFYWAGFVLIGGTN